VVTFLSEGVRKFKEQGDGMDFVQERKKKKLGSVLGNAWMCGWSK